jgi:hypothetical protein
MNESALTKEELLNEEVEKTEMLKEEEVAKLIQNISNEKETSDYNYFKFYDDNRIVKPKKVAVLEKSMRLYGFITTIILDQNGFILDGQNRYTAAKNIGIAIKYKVLHLLKPEYSKPIITVLNDTGDKFKVEDYLKLWGNLPDYAKLKKLIEDSKFKFFHVATLCGNVRGSKKFRDGKFEFSDTLYNKVKTKIKQIEEILDFNVYIQDLCKSKTVKAAIMGALVIIVRDDEYDHDRMLKKLKDNYTMLSPKHGSKSTSAVEYVIQFEQIYNKNMKKGIHIFSKTHN